jgi:hypothetical protein
MNNLMPLLGLCGAAIAYITETTRVRENVDVVRLPRFFRQLISQNFNFNVLNFTFLMMFI